MTYAELYEMINNMTAEQRDQDVTVFVRGVDEYYPLDSMNPTFVNQDSDVVDTGQVVLKV